jgi:phage terminase small subunit
VASDLTPRQQSFADHFLVVGNATEAAKLAGYSEKTAHVQGSRLLRNAQVDAYIRTRSDAISERLEISAERIRAELARIAFSDLTEVATWEKDSLELIKSADLSEDAARSLREVVATTSQTEHGTTNRLHVKQHDKMKALELLGKHLGMFREKLDVHHTGGLTLTALARMVEPEGEAGRGEIEG